MFFKLGPLIRVGVLKCLGSGWAGRVGYIRHELYTQVHTHLTAADLQEYLADCHSVSLSSKNMAAEEVILSLSKI